MYHVFLNISKKHYNIYCETEYFYFDSNIHSTLCCNSLIHLYIHVLIYSTHIYGASIMFPGTLLDPRI